MSEILGSKDNQVGKLTALTIGTWFIFSATMGLSGKFKSDRNRPPLSLGLTLLLPIMAFSFLYRKNDRFRAFCQSIDLRALTIAHVWRILGADFLVQRSRGRLPGAFAYPAGIGDIIAGIGALGLFFALQSRTGDVKSLFTAWNVFGILDLLVAVASGILHSESSAGVMSREGPSTLLMSEFPRSMVPTFLVPLFLLIHFLSLARSKELAPAKVKTGEQQPKRAAA